MTGRTSKCLCSCRRVHVAVVTYSDLRCFNDPDGEGRKGKDHMENQKYREEQVVLCWPGYRCGHPD
jgi:hypothetical protein